MNPTWLLRLYPRAWRARYGEELTALLDDLALTPLAVLDLLLGALDAHLHADLLPGRVLSMTSRLRSSMIAVFCAFALFVLGYLSFSRLTDPCPPFQAVAQAHLEVALAWNALQGAAALAGLAVLAGGLPILGAALLDALRGGRREILALLALPVAGAVVCAILLAVAQAVAPPIPPGQQVRPVTGAFAVLGLLFFAAAFVTFVGGIACVAVAISRSTLGARVLRFAVWPATAAEIAMATSLVATVSWAALLWRAAPQIYGGILGDCADTQCYGPSGDIGVGGVAVIAVLMAVAVVIGALAVRRAFAARTEGTPVPM